MNQCSRFDHAPFGTLGLEWVAGEGLDVNTTDKSLMEKLPYLEQLEEKRKVRFFALLDSLIAKKKLKDNLSNLVAG